MPAMPPASTSCAGQPGTAAVVFLHVAERARLEALLCRRERFTCGLVVAVLRTSYGVGHAMPKERNESSFCCTRRALSF